MRRAESTTTTSEENAAVFTERRPQSVRAMSALSTYRKEQFLNLSPVEVVQRLYDVAIMACKKNDTILAQKALSELVVSLNFEYKEISLGLFRLYDYCKQNIRAGKSGEAIIVLEELRATWAEAFKKH